MQFLLVMGRAFCAHNERTDCMGLFCEESRLYLSRRCSDVCL